MFEWANGRDRLSSEHLHIVQQVCTYIDQHLDEAPTLAAISAHVNVSPFHLQRLFKRVMGISPKQYAEAVRIDCLKLQLRGGKNVTDALYHAGYGSSSRLYESAHEKLGMTPGEYSRGGAGMQIHYTVVESSLGLLLVAMTEKGICSVCLGENETELVAALYREYPKAVFERNRVVLCNWVTQLLEHLQGTQPHLDLPLDVQATAFQQRVWHELMRIPYGQTRTYGEIAAAIGHPGAASAVAQACHANPTSLIIPCHRAVREDGQPAQYYRGERERRSKQTFLENEQQRLKKLNGEMQPFIDDSRL